MSQENKPEDSIRLQNFIIQVMWFLLSIFCGSLFFPIGLTIRLYFYPHLEIGFAEFISRDAVFWPLICLITLAIPASIVVSVVVVIRMGKAKK